jgi:hypothetical protein
MKTLAFGKTAGCIVFACGKHPLDDSEWDAYAHFLEKEFIPGPRRSLCLVSTDGAGPTAAQRQRVNEVIAPVVKHLRAAVLTSSNIARGIVTAMSWINPVYRAFAPDEMDKAIEFLGIDEAEIPQLKRLLTALKEELVRA